MLTELEKYRAINAANTLVDLQLAVVNCADEKGEIPGRSRSWSDKQQALEVHNVIMGLALANVLTRTYGIRQQAMYIRDTYHR